MSDTALGPLTAKSPANLVALRELLIGYEVRPVNVGGAELASLEYQVFEDGEKVFAVIPDEDGAILNVHVVSPKVTVAAHPWKVGEPFTNAAALTACDCWGGKAVCFKKGEHVAVAFDRQCRGLGEPRGRRGLEGLEVHRTIWNPKPFGSEDDQYGGHEYGGTDDPCGDPCSP